MADSALAALSASSALTGTELFYADNGAADVKVTATQIKTFATSGLVGFSGNSNTTVALTADINVTNPNTGRFINLNSDIVTVSKFFTYGGTKRVSSQFDKTNATLADITSLSVNLAAATTYKFLAELFVDADTTGGLKVAIGGTATATAIVYNVSAIDNGSPGSLRLTSRQTALAGAASCSGQAGYLVRLEGTITVNVAGTLTVQFAQSSANGTSSVLVGSHLIVHQF